MGFRSEAGGGDGLVRSFAAWAHVKLGTDQGFSKHWHPVSGHGHSDGKAPDDRDDWALHGSVLSETGSSDWPMALARIRSSLASVRENSPLIRPLCIAR